MGARQLRNANLPSTWAENEHEEVLDTHSVSAGYTDCKWYQLWLNLTTGLSCHGSRADVVSRPYLVSEREVETFFIRTLLIHVRAALAFAEIRSVHSDQCHSFREGFKVHVILASDADWVHDFADACGYQFFIRKYSPHLPLNAISAVCKTFWKIIGAHSSTAFATISEPIRTCLENVPMNCHVCV